MLGNCARRAVAHASPVDDRAVRHPLRRAALLLALGLTAGALMLQQAEAMETAAREAILVDYDTGVVLFEKDADVRTPPASMSKMMTAYLLFEGLKQGRIKPDQTLPVSENAWRRGGAASGGSTMFLNIGDQVPIEELIRGVIVQSGNDASIVVAEGLAGSEEAFAELMSKKAKELGMSGTHYQNANGLPDPDEYTTVRDLATLAKRTIEDFPEYYHFYSEREYVHNGIKQGNRNPLLYRNIGVDGLKTGHTKEAGYCLTSSAKQGDRRLILVTTGLPSMKARSEESERLLGYGFREFDNYTLFKAGEEVAKGEVWLGDEKTVSIVPEKDAIITLPRKARPDMKVTLVMNEPIPAPISKGQQVAKLVVTAPGQDAPDEIPLVAANDVPRLGFFGRVFASLGQRIGSIF